MNKIYKVIWSKVRNCYVAVSEIAKRNGKSCTSVNCGGKAKGIRGLRMAAVTLGVTAALVGGVGFGTPAAWADGTITVSDASQPVNPTTTTGGTLDYSYEKTKLPIHLIQELVIIEETLSRIQSELKSRNVDRCFMIADHGATRLAVVAQKDYDYSISEFEVAADVSHGGRVCKYSEDAANLEETTCVDTMDGKFCVVAGYKRFKGGRRPTVEVHGGATLEEVAVPIIEICLKQTNVEIWIETPEVTVGFGINAKIKIASKTVLKNVFMEINGKKIPAIEMSGQKFSFDVPKSIKAGMYDVRVFENGNLLKSDLKCEIKKKMAQERNLL